MTSLYDNITGALAMMRQHQRDGRTHYTIRVADLVELLSNVETIIKESDALYDELLHYRKVM